MNPLHALTPKATSQAPSSRVRLKGVSTSAASSEKFRAVPRSSALPSRGFPARPAPSCYLKLPTRRGGAGLPRAPLGPTPPCVPTATWAAWQAGGELCLGVAGGGRGRRHLSGAEGCCGKEWGGQGANHCMGTHPACLWPGSVLSQVPTFFHCVLITPEDRNIISISQERRLRC